ncbi:MAG: hypothetical protein IT345_10710 [Trueperaceae bacterium]|nr:hypothetical protein [Trueperaceae bacterium]
MADKQFPHPVRATEDSTDPSYVRLRDESDGTFAPVARARLELWDAANTTWIRARANPQGALLLDRGGVGADISASATYTTSQAATVLVSVSTAFVAHVTAVMVGYANGGSASPNASIANGANVVARHPGIPAGGGFAFSDIDLSSGVAGDDITVTCDAPTGSSISFTVHYYLVDA